MPKSYKNPENGEGINELATTLACRVEPGIHKMFANKVMEENKINNVKKTVSDKLRELIHDYLNL